MKDTLVSYDLALLAKEKGFDEITDVIYNTQYNKNTLMSNFNNLKNSDGNNPLLSAPTLSLLQKWLREKFDIEIFVTKREFAAECDNGYYFTVGTSNFIRGKSDEPDDALEKGLNFGLNEIK